MKSANYESNWKQIQKISSPLNMPPIPKREIKEHYGKELKEKNDTLRQRLKTASKKGGKVQQIVKAPNPPQTETIRKVKKTQKITKQFGPTI